MARLGIFGGAFDPPHLGHLILAEQAQEQLSLQRVFWLLTPDPPHKDPSELTPYPIRKRMLEAAIADNNKFSLCELERERPGPHYLVDTLLLLRKRDPAAEYFLLIGEDSLRDLPTWHRPSELITLCPVATMRRRGATADLPALEQAIPGLGRQIRFLEAPSVEISSTEVRRRVRAGKTVRYMVPWAVDKIVTLEQLYR